MVMKYGGSFPPWSRIDDLAKMTREAGVDFDEFIACLQRGATDEEMADRFNVSKKTIKLLKDHFFHYGVNSTMGGD
ncbi:hypothetical protein SAMN02745221_00474 [Thermosyntropha lipolytica DSM 11003]|uniref:Uncharacterized protein n=1 Tax=Thermosyntropha lipolytica DSM 11003 TaxID=1123382 RepID=A0A1M5KVX7_9FIRM|nr:hypothetical protein [Thermosyntropha lipolytica]SHG56323.1 hypothetical protein SAMN02745221_00474 [Thermosyntropha lipolytica DSM 11003]